MKRSKHMLFRIGVSLTLLAPSARGQGGPDTWGFVNARYDTRSSASIYTGYGWRRAFVMGGVLRNPRSGFAEMLVGVGGVYRTGTNAEHWLAVASARTGAVSSAQIFWLPTLRVGVVTTRATVKSSIATNGRAPQKLSISPLSMTVPVGRWLAGGVAVEMAATKGARTSIGTGIEARLRLPGATLGANAIHDVTGNGSRLRMFFASRF